LMQACSGTMVFIPLEIWMRLYCTITAVLVRFRLLVNIYIVQYNLIHI
jgi:hypothetical protein